MIVNKISKKHTQQLDQSDCGVVCLQTILKYYNSNYSLEKLREYSGGFIDDWIGDRFGCICVSKCKATIGCIYLLNVLAYLHATTLILTRFAA
jgi:hypothetical protein